MWHGLPVIRHVGELKTCSSSDVCVWVWASVHKQAVCVSKRAAFNEILTEHEADGKPKLFSAYIKASSRCSSAHAHQQIINTQALLCNYVLITVETHTHKSPSIPVTKTYSLTHTNKTIQLPSLSVGTEDKLLRLVFSMLGAKAETMRKMVRVWVKETSYWRTTDEEESKCKQESKEQKRKNKLIFHQMSSRPDDNGAAATCIITPRTTDCPAAQILHSRGQRESSHGAFKRDY